jgi:hypothetical protein
MNKLLAILNSKYFLVTVIGLSILVIIIGVLMVKHANEQALIHSQQSTEKQVDNSDQEIIQQFQQLAASAEAELAASKVDGSQSPKNMDIIPDESKQKVERMSNKNPELGSEDWCELLMVKPGKDWSQEDQANFAKHCLD